MSTVTKYPYFNPELWGGIECTINRVKNTYRDQLLLSGHYDRLRDIEKFAELGIRKLRYPVLWERHEPVQNQKINWSWANERLNTIRKNKIVPIVGLLHHGSGPHFTDLGDKEFPEKLAAYGLRVAKQFPWVMFYTPVNEPLTTARFSGLYGFWYPHRSNEKCFVEMLLNQVKGTILTMRAIRTINPDAQLIQTEDLSKTHSTPLLNYQAGFENERRWLTYDLLCGRMNRDHFFWNYFLSLGIPEKSLQFFAENCCPPAIAGFNYYVTSERYLDEHTDNYPSWTHGGNHQHRYADTEAVRTGHNHGITPLLTEAWDRYQIPLAVSECHLSCSREEQLRWVKEIWDSCRGLNEKGVEIKAVTAWALLGAFDWNSLLTEQNNYYESGVFDIGNSRVRPTLLAKMIRSLSLNGSYAHPLLHQKGWWHSNRLLDDEPGNYQKQHEKTMPLLIIGKTGTLGNAFIRICQQRCIPFVALGRKDVNILDEESIRAAIKKYKPWGMINASGYVKVDEAEINRRECYAVNATAPSLLARLCYEYGIRFMSFSSDLVFDGSKGAPYFEGDEVLPLNVYGSSKAEGERLMLAENVSSLIIRTSAFFGPWDQYNFVYTVMDSLKYNRELSMPTDVIVSPTYVPDLCHAAMDLYIDEEEGIWHLSNDGMTSWSAFAGIIAERTGFKKNKLVGRPLIEMGWKASRPLYSVLQSNKGIKLPNFENALTRYFEQLTV